MVFTALLIYMDDLILDGDDLNEIQSVKTHPDREFKIKDLGSLKYFLGLVVARSKLGISLCQRKYALDLLKDIDFLASKLVCTQMVKGTSMHQQDSDPYHDLVLYIQFVGRLLYLTNTHPDLSFAIQRFSQFMASPTINHHKAMTRVLRYIKGTFGQGLFYPTRFVLHVKGFSNSDWASFPDTRHCISAYCMYLGDSLISWKCIKQNIVSRYSFEAEYRALAIALCEIQ
ncbi:PREDICTED: uncharacterized protein LOC109338588 [Lupinus angustifolius]|uniref:uncharacterized protein LOC109338588 n=1 Tax=Lupinus angustifolius TaxID=3871 RepID=UPI00092F03FC|nr:PREDICTED: uncharacterized protein LOC109338588 [Lupinus angustifolius]